jgi:hypothetical protein
MVFMARPKNIPEEIDFDNLLDRAIICDYYDCAAVMNPWVKTWMKQLQEFAIEPGYGD